MDLMNALVALCKSTQLVPKASPKDRKGSLGPCERGHLSVQGQLRMLRGMVQEKYKITLDSNPILIPWLCTHSSWIIERFQPRWSGHTVHHSMRGKDYAGIVVDFAETIQYRVADISDKLNVRWIKHLRGEARGVRRVLGDHREGLDQSPGREAAEWRRSLGRRAPEVEQPGAP